MKQSTKVGLGLTGMMLLLAFVPAAEAAAIQFGSIVMKTDPDFRPTLTNPTGPVFCRRDFGTTGTISDDGFFLSFQTATGTGTSAGQTLANNDVFLTASGGKNPGAYVTDSDTAAKQASGAMCRGFTLAVIDVNSDGFRTDADYYYIGFESGTTTGLTGSTDTGDWWVRASAAGAKAAGTVVLAGDSDIVTYGAGAVMTGDIGFFDADGSGGAIPNTGDWLYSAPGSPFTGASLVPLYSERLVHPTFAFGSIVKANDNDFVPTLTVPGSAPTFCRRDFGTTGTISDDGFFLGVGVASSASATLINNGIFLTASGGKNAGDLVTDSDTAAKQAGGADCRTTVFAWIDVNSDGFRTDTDYYYAGQAATTTGTIVEGSQATGEWWVRLNAAGAKAAGTVVLAGDSDIVTYGGGAIFPCTSTNPCFTFAFFDADGSSAFNTGDWRYMVLHTGSALSGSGVLAGLYSVRLGGHPSKAFGTVIMTADTDFVPQVQGIGSGVQPGLCRRDFGTTGTITDDGFFLSLAVTASNTASTLANNDIFLTASGGKNAGALVTDSDTSAKQASGADCRVPVFAWIDVNSDGFKTDADYYYVGLNSNTAAVIEGSQATGDWWVRLNAAGAKAAGTVVLAGDSDIVTYGGGQALTSSGTTCTAPGCMAFAFFDANGSGAFNTGDWAYILMGATAATTLRVVTLYSIRLLGGDLTSIAPPPGAPPAAPPGAPPAAPPGAPPAAPPGAPPAAPPAAPTTSRTPGFELAAVAVGLAVAALVGLRRKDE